MSQWVRAQRGASGEMRGTPDIAVTR